MKKFLLTLGLVTAIYSANAQGLGSQAWTSNLTTFATPSDIVRTAPVAVSSDGSVITSGSFNLPLEVGDNDITPVGNSSFISKYTTTGTQQWLVALRGAATVTSVTTDGDGNVYAVGTLSGDVILTNASGANAATIKGNDGSSQNAFFVVKYNSNGELVGHQEAVASTRTDIATAEDGFYIDEPNLVANNLKWKDGRIYFTLRYAGVSTLAGLSLSGDYLNSEGLYLDIRKSSVLSLNASNLSDAQNHYTIGSNTQLLTTQQGVSSLNYVFGGDNLYVAAVATGPLVITTPNKTENVRFAVDADGKREFGFIFSEVNSSVTLNTPYNSSTVDLLNNQNEINSMIVDNNNVYVGGIFNAPAVFGQERNIVGGSDSFVAAFSRSSNQLLWVGTSQLNDGSAGTSREAVTGLAIANNKLLLTGYTENTGNRTTTAGFAYSVADGGQFNSLNTNVVYSLATNNNILVTSNVDATTLQTIFTAYTVDETTSINNSTLASTNTISRNGDNLVFTQPTSAQVIDLQGRVVLSDNNTTQLSIASLQKGVYVLRANNEVVKFNK